MAAEDYEHETYAYLAEEDEPFTDPAHWYGDDFEEDGNAYYAEEEQPAADEWNDFSAVSDEWARNG